jgi:CRISPR-associated endonuclease Csn1
LKFPETVRFNFETTRKKLDGHLPDHVLGSKKHLGRRWKDLCEETKNKIVDILIEEDQERETVRRLTTECGLTAEDSECIATVNFPEGYLSHSRRAIGKLLPYLERGMMLMGNDASDSAIHAAGYLRPDERVVNQRQFLPPSPNVTNPIVRQALVEVRKTVNSMLREFVHRQGHLLAAIHVELAREAKKSFEERKKIRFDNADRERERERAVAWIENFNASIKPTRKTVNRYLLWQSQEEFCAYCGQRISPEQLFNGDADLDHILPRWRSLDDSMANQVVAHRRCNQEKGDRTPREWLEGGDPERYERVLHFAERHLSYGKRLKFLQKDIVLDDFVKRQLNDTAYITRCVAQYLRCLGATVICTRGDMTADVRHWWGLNSILQADGSNRKNRDDHRHHTVDAVVIAMTDAKRLFAVANDRGEDVRPPWEGFRREAEHLIQSVNVSHRVQRRLHGALHEETFYGVTQKRPETDTAPAEERPWAKNWTEDLNTFLRRKSLDSLAKTQDLDKIRDPAIREIL